MNKRDEGTAWEQGWDAHQVQQLRRLARLPLAEKLEWLEEAHHLVRHLTRATPNPTVERGARSESSKAEDRMNQP